MNPGTMTRGRLVVFEGPDGGGKTTLHGRVAERMPSGSTLALAFPGNTPRSLGKLVYDIHHGTLQSTDQPSQAALQMLHVAAHLDTIERLIRPAIESGTTVLLDRYWWSTWVYGIHDGVPRGLVDKMIDVEKSFLGDLAPDVVFLLVPAEPLGNDISVARYKRLSVLYREMAKLSDCPVDVVDWQMTRQEASAHVVGRLARLPGLGVRPPKR